MNMPPLPYVKRIPGLDYDALKPAIRSDRLDSFDPRPSRSIAPRRRSARRTRRLTCCVTLPTNFKVARFDDPKATAMAAQLQDEIEAIVTDTGDARSSSP